jgi:hypothetical protein
MVCGRIGRTTWQRSNGTGKPTRGSNAWGSTRGSSMPGGSVPRSRDDVRNLVAEPKPGALWASKYRPTDRVVVFAERPIDAVAYERRHGGQEACYLASGGALDPGRSRRIGHLLAEAKGEMRVVIGYRNGHRGEEMASQLRALAPMLPMERQGPEFGARWAEQMQLEGRHARSLARKPRGGPGRASTSRWDEELGWSGDQSSSSPARSARASFRVSRARAWRR